jgi:uncharacterized membrane protein YgdD (TMEM256/DUF423 family)
MSFMRSPWTFVGAILGALAVVAGAFGAHGLRERLSAEALEWWQTAAHYHLVHALVLVVVGVLADRAAARAGPTEESTGLSSRALSIAGTGLVVGVALFSGSLYALALTGARWLGAVTPFGGLALIAGWAALAAAAWSRGRRRS